MSETGATAPGGAAPEGGTPPADATQAGQPPVIDLEGLDIPQELTPFMEQYIREKVDPHLGEKLRESAETRKRFEPLSGIEGLSDIAPEELAQLVQFHGIASDPEQFQQWFTDVALESAKANPEEMEEWWADLGRQMDWLEGDGDDGDLGEPEEDPRIDELRQEIEAIKQERQQEVGQREQNDRVAERQQVIDGQLNEALAKLGDLDDEAKAATRQDIIKLAHAYVEDPDNSIPKAFEDYLRITGKGASDLIDSKLDQPEGGLPRGRAADTRPEITPDNVKEVARQKFNGRVGSLT